VCHSRLALDICADTCGLCAKLNNTVCEDTVNAGGCADLAANSDVCSDSLAVFICPKTCNKCDELINSIAISLVDGGSNSTSIPATMLPASVNPSDFPTYDCNDLNGQNCAIVGSLCNSSFIQVVCPDNCNACAAPINANPSTAAADPTTPMPTDPVTPMKQDTTMIMMTATMGADPDVTGAQSQGDDNSTSVSSCVDRLDGMSCTDLVDVCSSLLALSVCPKYCNLC